MEQGFDLGAFLAEQRAAGEQDSEGSFTVSAERALSKLARFALPGEYDWVLKIVQAINAWEAPEMVVRQTRVATSFTFLPKTMSGLDEQIVKCLQSGTLNNASPIHLLSMALRSLVDQAQLSFVLAIRHHGELGKPIFAGSDTSKMSPETREEWTRLEREGVRLTVSHFRGGESFTGRFTPTIMGIPRRDLEISNILDKRAPLSGTSIVLDGRRVTDLAKHPIWGHSKWSRPLRIATWEAEDETYNNADIPVLVKAKDLQVCPPPAGFLQPWYYLRTAEWTSFRTTARGFFTFRPPQGPHAIVWVRYGVIVERRSVYNQATCTRLLFVLPADQMRSDLSGLAVQIDDQHEAHVCKLAQSLAEDLQTAAGNLHQWTRGAEFAPDAATEPTEHSTAEDLSAGHSIYTVSITPKLDSMRLPVGKFLRKLETLVEPPFIREKILGKWTSKVGEDLKKIAKSLHNRGKRGSLFTKEDVRF